MNSQAQRVALPAYLPKRLQAYRVGGAPNETYVIRDKLHAKTYHFEPWQYFVLEVLPGCENFAKLAVVFQDRFGHSLNLSQLNELLAMVADNNLLDDGASHPLIAPFAKKGYSTETGTAVIKEFRPATPPAAATAAEPAGPQSEEELPPGVQDVVGFDKRATRKLWVLFDPRPLLKAATPFVAPLRYAVYLLPLLAIGAVGLTIQQQGLIRADMERLLGGVTLLGHLVFSLFTVNLLVTLTAAFVAHHYRATVSGFGVALYFGFLPRFVTQAGNLKQTSRRERMWLHAAPLLMRLALLCVGLLLWHSSRASNGDLPQLGLSMALIGAISLLLSANPLVRGSGYHLLAAFLNETHLRGKAYKTLLNRYRGGVYKEAGSGLLGAYGLACIIFMFVVTIAAVTLFGVWLRGTQIGGSAILLIVAVGIYLYRRTSQRMRKIDAAYERSAQFERWRTRVVPEESTTVSAEARPTSGFRGYLLRAAPLTLLALLFVPYSYDVGGSFTVFPTQRQELATDIAGVIAEVSFDGGETVTQGTVIARLANDNYQAQVAVYEARMQQQMAIITDLKLRPKPEEVQLAGRTLEVARTQAAYSRDEMARVARLYKQNAVSQEEYAKRQRQYDVDLKQVAEKQAALDLVKTGATLELIQAEEAKWRSLKAERDSYQSMIQRSALVMPFDGTILTLHLKNRINSYLKAGEVFAVVEDAGQVMAEIEVPETDIGYFKNGAEVRARTASYSQDVFAGRVTTVAQDITVKPFGNVVKVIAVLDNKDGKLMSGMTGYAKVTGETMPVWKAFSLAIQRFVMLQIWSWVP